MTAAVDALTCREVADFLGAYAAGDLGPLERRVFDAHLAGCADCGTYLAQYELTQRLVRRAGDSALEAGMPEQLVAAILAAKALSSGDG